MGTQRHGTGICPQRAHTLVGKADGAVCDAWGQMPPGHFILRPHRLEEATPANTSVEGRAAPHRGRTFTPQNQIDYNWFVPGA